MQNEQELKVPFPFTARDKNWDELTTDEKIERMRGEVKVLQNRVKELIGKVNSLEDHDHKDGKMILPFRGGHGGYITESESSGRRRVTDWF